MHIDLNLSDELTKPQTKFFLKKITRLADREIIFTLEQCEFHNELNQTLERTMRPRDC